MKIKKIAALLYAFTAFAALSVTTVSCDDNKSYSELLEDACTKTFTLGET